MQITKAIQYEFSLKKKLGKKQECHSRLFSWKMRTTIYQIHKKYLTSNRKAKYCLTESIKTDFGTLISVS